MKARDFLKALAVLPPAASALLIKIVAESDETERRVQALREADEIDLRVVSTPVLRDGVPHLRWSVVSDQAFPGSVRAKDGKWERLLGEVPERLMNNLVRRYS